MIVDGRFVTPPGARFPRQDLPVFDCYVSISTLKAGSSALLLFDTGGEQTAIMPNLGKLMGIPYGQLKYSLRSGGIGSARYCEYPGVVAFYDKAGNYRNFRIDIAIFKSCSCQSE